MYRGGGGEGVCTRIRGADGCIKTGVDAAISLKV